MMRPVSAMVEKHGIQNISEFVLTDLNDKTLLLENLNPGKSCTYHE
jgi:hypothetical protein